MDNIANTGDTSMQYADDEGGIESTDFEEDEETSLNRYTMKKGHGTDAEGGKIASV